MEAETLAGLFGFGGAVLGALIGGGTTLLATRLTMTHQRTLAREDRLRELGEAAVELCLSHCDQLRDSCASVSGEELGVRMQDYNLLWSATSRQHLTSVAQAVRRIPDRAVYDRVMMLVRLGDRWRGAGDTYLMGVMFMISVADEISDALIAYLRHDDLPPMSEVVQHLQSKVDGYTERPGVVRPLVRAVEDDGSQSDSQAVSRSADE
ncbi:hypothetical protein ACWD4J_29615 [Streptomyces sp. NPDC002577]